MVLEDVVDEVEDDVDKVSGEMRFRQSVLTQETSGGVEGADFDGDNATLQAVADRLPDDRQQTPLGLDYQVEERLRGGRKGKEKLRIRVNWEFIDETAGWRKKARLAGGGKESSNPTSRTARVFSSTTSASPSSSNKI